MPRSHNNSPRPMTSSYSTSFKSGTITKCVRNRSAALLLEIMLASTAVPDFEFTIRCREQGSALRTPRRASVGCNAVLRRYIACRFVLEGWPSGLRRTLGKRVYGKPYRGFESHSLRHITSIFSISHRRNTRRAGVNGSLGSSGQSHGYRTRRRPEMPLKPDNIASPSYPSPFT
jgi:hypothetical protein